MIPFFLGAAGGAPVASQVFATTLYTGNGSSQTIANGIDTDLAWIKARSEAWDHALCDQLRGINAKLRSNSTINELTGSGSVTAFGTTGFTVGSQDDVNRNLVTYVAWSFARAARFFDVVTWTGDGSSNRQIAHSLGIAPGLILVKSRSGVRHWTGQHRSLGPTQDIVLSLANAAYSEPNAWNNTAPTSANFTVGSYTSANNNLETYVAYLFAHDTASDGIVQCGSYTGNQSPSGPTITLGWQPQFLIFKNASATGDWIMMDTARGIPAGSGDAFLRANTSDAEVTGQTYVDVSGTGFSITAPATSINGSGNTIVYLAIRA